jgi:hypothetical protein
MSKIAKKEENSGSLSSVKRWKPSGGTSSKHKTVHLVGQAASERPTGNKKAKAAGVEASSCSVQ